MLQVASKQYIDVGRDEIDERAEGVVFVSVVESYKKVYALPYMYGGTLTRECTSRHRLCHSHDGDGGLQVTKHY